MLRFRDSSLSFVVIGVLVTMTTLFSGIPSTVFARVPNDPKVEQWGFDVTKVSKAWDYTTGSRHVVVAIIDNGFDDTHPDLVDNVWHNVDEIPRNGIDDDQNGYIDDVSGWNFVPEDQNGDGTIDEKEKEGSNTPRPVVTEAVTDELKRGALNHATVIAGIIGGVGDNNLYGTGINWKVQLMNIKVIGNNGVAHGVRLGDAIRYAVNNGADIINLSVVTGLSNDDVAGAVRQAYERGVLVVSAAGNDMRDLNDMPLYPICLDLDNPVTSVIGVSAVTEGRVFASFSNSGSRCIDITAPGTGIGSTVVYEPSIGLTEGYSVGWKGTSFAAPFVSGAAALIKSIQPSWGAKEVTEALFMTVSKTPPEDEIAYANLFGRGLIQVGAAVEYAALKRQSLGTTGAFIIKNKNTTELQLLDGIMLDVSTSGDVEDVAVEEKEGRLTIAVATRRGAKRFISMYDRNGGLIEEWSLPVSYPVDIVLSDVALDRPGREILVTPRTSSRELVRIYDTNGLELERFTTPNVHATARLVLLPQKIGEAGKFAVAFEESRGVSIRTYDGRTSIQTVHTPIKRLGAVTMVQRGTTEREFVFGALKGAVPIMTFVGEDGTIARTVTAYDPSIRGEFFLGAVDRDGDGVDELVTVLTGQNEVRFWDGAHLIETVESTIPSSVFSLIPFPLLP